MAGPLADAPTGIHEAFSAGLPVHICASVHGVGEHVVDGGVGGYDPADALEPRHLEREVQLFGAEPQPHPASRAELAEASKTVRMAPVMASSGWRRTSPSCSPQTSPTGRPRRSSPRAALWRMPPSRRERRTWSSASDMVLFNPSTRRSLKSPG